MKEVEVFLLESEPRSEAGGRLREILESCETPRIEIRHEILGLGEPIPGFERTFSDFTPDAIFLALSSSCLAQTRRLIGKLTSQSPKSPIIAIMEDHRPEDMMDLLKLGVVDFVTPPLKPIDILPRLWRLLEGKHPEERLIHSLKERMGLKQLVGESHSFVTEVEKIPMVARCDASVLISGETGTGKELFARAIHYLSPRTSRPFVPASCGAIPLELAENELFGHVQGAYTGASSSQTGLIQEGQGGTLFLDEIDCLPLAAQVKLLRFLQEKEYKQLGSAKVHHADVRVIAATNVELEKAAREGRFRQDLYYRLNIIPLTLPPLRERKEDIPFLANHFLEKHASEANWTTKRFSPEAIQKLMAHDWPGNVRELENVVERAVILSKGLSIESTDILLPCAEDKNSRESFKEAKARMIEQFEKKYIRDLLLACQGNISKASEAAHKNRRAFWELIRKYKIDVTSLKAPSKPG